MTNYLTATQAAERLGTSLTNVARWCREKTGTFASAKRLNVGKSRIWQIPVEAVEAFTPPARGPKPAEDRKRLIDLAFEYISSPDDSYDDLTVTMLARRGQCSRARARQALAKAIRLARAPKEE